MPDHSARASTAVRECAPRAIVEFRRTPNGAAVMSVVTADLDRNTVGIFRTAFRALLEDALPEGAATGAGTARAETAIRLVVVNLSAVDFMSIDATSVLLEAKELVERRGIGFAVVVTTRGVTRALSVTGAGAFLTCHSSTDAAEHHGMPGTRP